MGRWRGCIWLTAGLIVAILAGAVAFIIITSVGEDTGEGGAVGPQTPVVVAKVAIEVRTRLTAEDVEVIQIPLEAAPPGAVGSTEEVIGKVTLVDLYPGEILLTQRLIDPNVITGDGRLALIISEAEDEVLMAFPIEDLMSRIGVLKAGDHVDMLFSLEFPIEEVVEVPAAEAEEGASPEESTAQIVTVNEQFTFHLLQNVSIAAVVGGPTSTREGEQGSPQALLLTINPQDALLLKYAVDAGGIVDIVLRAPGVERPFDTDPVDIQYLMDQYGIR